MPRQTQTILRKVKHKLGDVSAYRAAKDLGVTQQAVSKWENGHNIMGDDVAIKAAEILGENPEVLMALLAADRTQDEYARKIWINLARRLQRATAAALFAALGITAFLGSYGAHALAGLREVCILCKVRGRVTPAATLG